MGPVTDVHLDHGFVSFHLHANAPSPGSPALPFDDRRTRPRVRRPDADASPAITSPPCQRTFCKFPANATATGSTTTSRRLFVAFTRHFDVIDEHTRFPGTGLCESLASRSRRRRLVSRLRMTGHLPAPGTRSAPLGYLLGDHGRRLSSQRRALGLVGPRAARQPAILLSRRAGRLEATVVSRERPLPTPGPPRSAPNPQTVCDGIGGARRRARPPRLGSPPPAGTTPRRSGRERAATPRSQFRTG